MKIEKIEIYTPKQKRDNTFFHDVYPDQKEKADIVNERLGKDIRYVVSDEEDSLTLALGVVEKISKVIDLTTVDALIYSSNTAEYIVPTTSAIIHHKFGMNPDCLCTDLAAGCAGMLVAMECAQGMFATHEDYENILVVGSESLTRHVTEKQMVAYCAMGDIGCAMLLKRSPEKLYTAYHTQTDMINAIMFPNGGMSTIHTPIRGLDRKMTWDTQGGTIEQTYGIVKPKVEAMMSKHGIDKNQIGVLCCNQQAQHAGFYIADLLELNEDKISYIGDRYGYTGTTTIMIALYDRIQQGLLKAGEYILFCVAGAGGILVMGLLEYR